MINIYPVPLTEHDEERKQPGELARDIQMQANNFHSNLIYRVAYRIVSRYNIIPPVSEKLRRCIAWGWYARSLFPTSPSRRMFPYGRRFFLARALTLGNWGFPIRSQATGRLSRQAANNKGPHKNAVGRGSDRPSSREPYTWRMMRVSVCRERRKRAVCVRYNSFVWHSQSDSSPLPRFRWVQFPAAAAEEITRYAPIMDYSGSIAVLFRDVRVARRRREWPWKITSSHVSRLARHPLSQRTQSPILTKPSLSLTALCPLVSYQAMSLYAWIRCWGSLFSFWTLNLKR